MKTNVKSQMARNKFIIKTSLLTLTSSLHLPRSKVELTQNTQSLRMSKRSWFSASQTASKPQQRVSVPRLSLLRCRPGYSAQRAASRTPLRDPPKGHQKKQKIQCVSSATKPYQTWLVLRFTCSITRPCKLLSLVFSMNDLASTLLNWLVLSTATETTSNLSQMESQRPSLHMLINLYNN